MFTKMFCALVSGSKTVHLELNAWHEDSPSGLEKHVVKRIWSICWKRLVKFTSLQWNKDKDSFQSSCIALWFFGVCDCWLPWRACGSEWDQPNPSRNPTSFGRAKTATKSTTMGFLCSYMQLQISKETWRKKFLLRETGRLRILGFAVSTQFSWLNLLSLHNASLGVLWSWREHHTLPLHSTFHACEGNVAWLPHLPQPQLTGCPKQTDQRAARHREILES